MRFLGILAACAVLTGGAQAATISVENGDFEGGGALANSAAGHGSWDLSPAGWTTDGVAGVWEFPSALANDPGDELGNRVGFANKDASIGQNLDATLYDGAEYTLSADFLHRSDYDTGGYSGFFGFFVGDITGNYTILSVADILDPGLGLFSGQSVTLKAENFSQYIGRQLGIIFVSNDRQIQFDNVEITTLKYPLSSLSPVVETPVPGAVWLFISALAAGRVVTRRKKARAAANAE